MRSFTAVMALAGAAVVTAAMPATMASAHADTGYRTVWSDTSPAYAAGQGAVYDYHHQVNACDLSADGWGVVTRFQTADGAWHAVNDGNGSASGCGSTYTATEIVLFKTCYRSYTSIEYCNSAIRP
ncbi:hypothetical protein R8Z50_11515 [Longispora sp. K20-0274]|uniref:hypothetical protein n=1 Tax=Longispora sp. K20-0274 TaxID=3088255 RepID=UPI00399A2414